MTSQDNPPLLGTVISVFICSATLFLIFGPLFGILLMTGDGSQILRSNALVSITPFFFLLFGAYASHGLAAILSGLLYAPIYMLLLKHISSIVYLSLAAIVVGCIVGFLGNLAMWVFVGGIKVAFQHNIVSLHLVGGRSGGFCGFFVSIIIRKFMKL